MKKFLNEREKDFEKRQEETEAGFYKQKNPNLNENQPNNIEIMQLKQDLEYFFKFFIFFVINFQIFQIERKMVKIHCLSII